MGGELYNGHAFKEHMEESYITFPGELLRNLTFEWYGLRTTHAGIVLERT